MQTIPMKLAMVALSVIFACASASAQTPIVPPPSPRAPAPEPAGSVYVTSLPANADLWVDGTHVGRTPLLVTGLARGRHTLTIARSGWIPQDLAFRILPNTVALQNHYLVRAKNASPRPGTVVVHATSGTNLRIDGVPIGETDKPLPLAAGRHVADVDLGKTHFQREFDVVAETQSDLLLRAQLPVHAPAVVAPVSAYIPRSAIVIEHDKCIVRYRGHVAVGHLGNPSFQVDKQTLILQPAPILLDGELYLPLEIIDMLNSSG